MTPDKTRVGRVIATLRERRSLTQTELALGVGVAENTIGRWERGETAPSLVYLGALCRALRVRPEVFVDLPLRAVERWFVE